MIFPEKVSSCLNCDSDLIIIDDNYNFCDGCHIYYGLIIHNDPASFMIWDDGWASSVNYLNQSENKTLFNIDECKDFKEVLNRINKMNFPENLIKIKYCLNCNNLITICSEFTTHCEQCDIFYRDRIIFIYLDKNDDDHFYTIYSDGAVHNLDKCLFFIYDCYDFKTVMNKIHKIETFK